MVVVKEAVFLENGSSTYTASFDIPANAIFLSARSVNLTPWNDGGSPELLSSFNPGIAPNVLDQNLTDAAGSDAIANGVGSVGNAAYGAAYSSDRTFTVYVGGLHADGSNGVTRVLVQYYITDAPIVTVVRT